MRQQGGFSIRLIGLIDPDDHLGARGVDIPRNLLKQGARIAIFELFFCGIKNYVGIPTREPDEDAMISSGREALHEMLSTLAQESAKWKQDS